MSSIQSNILKPNCLLAFDVFRETKRVKWKRTLEGGRFLYTKFAIKRL
jgi:hypothetical protein